MSWAITRHKNNLYRIEIIPNYFECTESYTLLKLTDEERKKFMSLCEWKQDEIGVNTTSEYGEPVYKYFMELAKEKLKDKKQYNYSLKVDSTVEGTSRLIKSVNKGCIYIARRKGVKTANETRVNSVCISNELRDEFFDTVRNKHDYQAFIGSYSLYAGDKGFTYWSDIIDKEYLRQTGQL